MNSGREFGRVVTWYFAVWSVGLVASAIYCEDVRALDLPYRDFIPAIDAYALATANRCEAESIWLYAWATGPLVLLLFIYSGWNEGPWIGHRVAKVVVVAGLFFSVWTCYFGLYEPYPGNGGGRIELLFRENVETMVVVTASMWIALWVSCVSVLVILKH